MSSAAPHMTSSVLALQWRPQTFADLIGQKHVAQALSNALNQKRLHHAYLFTGTRGVGKTTVSRILAKSLNCEKGISAQPCLVCRHCVDIAQARDIDYLELDAASHRGVEEMTQILENARYQPNQARFKIFMLDEVHMLSSHAFNAMLKTLEDPPAHAKFILATTEVHKIPATIMSRCLQFHLHHLAPADIAQHLAHILDAENMLYEKQSLDLIAQHAQGSMRDALSLLDQTLAFGLNDGLNATQLMHTLGYNTQKTLDIWQQLAQQNIAQVLEYLPSIAQPLSLVKDMLAVLHDIALIQAMPKSLHQDQHAASLEALAKQISPENVQIMYDIIVKFMPFFDHCPVPHAALSMLCIRLSHFTYSDATPKVQAVSLEKNMQMTDQNSIVLTPTLALHTSDAVKKNHQDDVPTQLSQAVTPKPTPSVAWNIHTQANWVNLVATLAFGGLSLELVKNSRFVKFDNSNSTIYVESSINFKGVSTVFTDIERILSQHFGQPIHFICHVVSEPIVDSLAVHEVAAKKRNDEAITQAVMQDPWIKSALADGAIIDKIEAKISN